MAGMHVFAIDWVPAADDITSGGGLRSLQVIEALRLGGHKGNFSVPSERRSVQAMRLRASDRMRIINIHTSDNQIAILGRTWRCGCGLPHATSPSVGLAIWFMSAT